MTLFKIPVRSILLWILLLLVAVGSLPFSTGWAEGLRDSSFYDHPPNHGKEAREYTEWERRIAREIIATGHMMESDPHFDDVVTSLSQRGQSLLPSSSNVTQKWVRTNLLQIFPHLDSPVASAAMNAAANEMTRGTGEIANGFASSQVSLFGEASDYDISASMRETALRSGLEGAKAAASASNLHALNHLELEYSLSSGGIDEYSVLTVQPLWDSGDMRHNIFAQASYANKEVADAGASISDRRDTANAGLAYRYITPDEQHMFGINAFYDRQWPHHHSRMSLGAEYKTSLYGVAFNKYLGLSDWRGRDDGYEEKALGGEDLELSGRVPQLPELEIFAKGYHWSQEKTPVINPEGDDIWGYQFAAEYTPVNAFTIRSQATRDNEVDNMEGQISMRLNYRFGQGFDDLWERPTYRLDSVKDRRFEKVRRNNEIRVQVRQDPDVTARVTFAQGANVSVGQSLAFGTLITTGAAAGDSATVVFGNGAHLDVGQNTQVRIEKDQIVLIAGIIQFTSGTGGITVIAVPGGTIDLLGTDVDVRVAGGTATLRVRDGAADFTDDTGRTRVNTEELAEAQDGDGVAPQIRAEGTAIYATHTNAAHAQLDLVGPAPSSAKAAPFANEAVNVTGTLATGNTLTFTVPLTGSVTVTGTPQLRFTLGGLDRLADYASGSGTSSLVFMYTLVGADETLTNVVAVDIEKNAGTLIGTNGAPMVRTVSGGLLGSVPDVTAPTIAGITAVSSGGDPAGIGDTITVTLNANEDLVQSGAPTLSLNIGGTARTANFSAMNAGNAEFTYTVQAGDNDADGITITAINVAANELEDASGNDLDTTFALPHNLSLDVSTVVMGLASCPSGDLSTPANSGCARLFGADPTDIDDVMVYAGDVPGTTTDFFVRRCDLGQNYDPVDARCEGAGGNPATRATMQWKNLNTESSTTSIGVGTAWTNVNATDGPGNTALLLADGTGTHTAAETCNALLGGGWYLPALSELDVIYANLNATDDPDHPLPTVNDATDDDNSGTTGPLRASFDLTGQWYWSSSESNATDAWVQRFSDGRQSNTNKTNNRDVRCARR
jgi:hypothetical protein